MQKKTNKIRMLAGMVLLSFAMTLLAASGILNRMDLAVSDAFYQSRSASDGEIVLVGIDQKALDAIGPYSQWGRDIIAMALEALNASEECRPAVIAVDVLYSGETQTEADEWLAEAAGQYGNVVTACAAEFGSTLEEGAEGEYYLDTFSITAFDEPYDALKQATVQGHINAMLDTDGILRHHLLGLKLADGTEVPSLAWTVAERYREACGLRPVKLPPMDARGFWYVPFCGVPGDFYESISVADLLSGEITAEYFAGKIVLIGPYAAGLQDSYLTAADHAAPMYGVEYQANAVQALLWEDYKREAGDGIQLLVLFAALMAGMACFWKRRVSVSTAFWLLLCGGALLADRLLYAGGWVLHVLWIPVGVSVLYVGCIAWNYVWASLEKRRVTEIFKHHVAPEIVHEILKHGMDEVESGGKTTNIAVLFVDVRGFTTMSEKLKPEEVVKILNRYLTLISECILRHRGTLDKFVGDAAMAFWGAPLAQEDYVMKAVRAAADMVSGSRVLSEELLEKYGQTVSFGIGVHVGDAVVGNIGCTELRMDYTAIGDTVNTAARLEANAPGGKIYISRAVADALGDRIRVTSLGGSVPLKGKQEGFEVLILEEILE